MHTSSSRTYLVVEDDEPKLNAVVEAIKDADAEAKIVIGASVASGCKLITTHRVDLAVFDMSLPAYDFATDLSGGGVPQGQGGHDLLRLLEDMQPEAKAVVLTQYAEFSAGSSSSRRKLDEIAEDLALEFGALLIDVMYYSGRRGEWSSCLQEIVDKLKKGDV